VEFLPHLGKKAGQESAHPEEYEYLSKYSTNLSALVDIGMAIINLI